MIKKKLIVLWWTPILLLSWCFSDTNTINTGVDSAISVTNTWMLMTDDKQVESSLWMNWKDDDLLILENELKQTDIIDDNQVLPISSGLWYVAFSREELVNWLESQQTIVLHFYDSNSLVDQTIKSDIEKNITLLNDSILILRVDYNTDSVLVKKYGVKQANTFIKINNELIEKARISKWIVTLKTLISYFNL